MASSDEESEKRCLLSYVNGHELVTNNFTGPHRRWPLVQGFCRQQPNFVPDEIYALCFQWYYIDDLDTVRVNTIDLGLQSILRRKLVYKDTMYRELLIGWSGETGIPLNHLIVYNYTERKNKTMRPNARIEVDLNEEFKGNTDYTDDQIVNHLIPTTPSMKRIKGIYNRIGSVMERKRAFLLLDDRKITKLEGPKAENNARTILVALKYFDILEQKMYFVDWLRIKTTSITFADIAQHIESQLILQKNSHEGWLQSMYSVLSQITEFEAEKAVQEHQKFTFWEEEAALSKVNGGQDPLCKVHAFSYKDAVDTDFYNGDMFVFQINRCHPYFTDDPDDELDDDGDDNADNFEIIDDSEEELLFADLADNSAVHFDDEISNNARRQQLSRYFKNKKTEFERDNHAFWYGDVDRFIRSLVNSVRIEIRSRYQSQWEKQVEKDNGSQLVDELIRMNKSVHEWIVDEMTTFGMIRKRLASHYTIPPENIELWLPQTSEEENGTNLWNYGIFGRGEWDQPIMELMLRRAEWRQLCPLKFEIAAYDVKDLDALFIYQTEEAPSSELSLEEIKKIENVALYHVWIYPPPHGTIPGTVTSMTVIYQKDWTAKDFMQHILDRIMENPLFLSAYFGHITEYIRKCEMKDQHTDISIARNLPPNRFVIVDEEGKDVDYHMNDEYKMPESLSRIQYTDLGMHFLAKNDPLVVMDEETESNHKETYGLWVHILRQGNQYSSCKIRVIIEEGESFQDLILSDIWPYLKVNKLHSLSRSNDAESRIKDGMVGDAQDHLMKCIIESGVNFRVIRTDGTGGNNKGIIEMEQLLIRKNIGSSLTADMRLQVFLPREKTNHSS